MESETTRRTFLQGGTLAAAGLLATEATPIGQEPPPKHEHAWARLGSGLPPRPPEPRRPGG